MKRGILLFAAILAFVFLISCFRVEAGEVSTTVSEYGSQLYAELLWITVNFKELLWKKSDFF